MALISGLNKKNKKYAILISIVLFLSFAFSLFFIIWESKRFKLKEKKIQRKIYSFEYKLEYKIEDQRDKFKEYKSQLKRKKYRKALKILDSIYFPPYLDDYKFKERLRVLKLLKRDRITIRMCSNYKRFYNSPFYWEIIKLCSTIYRENKRWTKLKRLTSENREIFIKKNYAFYLFLNAEILRNITNNIKKAKEYYKFILINFPLSEYEKPINKVFPSILRRLTQSERLKRVKILINKRNFRRAKRELYKIKNSDDKNYYIGLIYYQKRQYNFAIRWLKKVKPASEKGVLACKYLLRIAYRKKKLTQIDNVYNECLRSGVDIDRLREIMGDFYFSNLILYRAKHFYEKAVEANVKLSQGKEIYRRLAWINYASGNIESTFEFYKNRYLYNKENVSSSEKYWYARLKERLYGKDRETKNIFREIAENYYYHYYGQLAINRISRGERRRIERIVEKREMDLPYTIFLTRELKRLDFFYKNELNNSFFKGLKYLSSLYNSEELKYYYMDELKRADNLYFIIRKRLDLKYPFSVRTPIKYLYYSYPLPDEYFSIIKREAEKFKIDPFLVVALIRQESLFNEGALSYAGARGLMQLMYYTARRLAYELNYRRIRKRHLYIPETNIKLGVYYLKKLFDRYGRKNYVYVLAAYNAGEHRVDYWDDILKDFDKSEFTEMIPFTQTRKYVKIILTNYFIYRKLYTSQ